MDLNNFMPKFMKIVNRVGNAIMLNLCFLVCCIPVVTIGPAWCGLMSAIRFEIRGDHWWGGFKEGMKTRFLRSCITGIIGTAAMLYFGNNTYACIGALLESGQGWPETIFTCVMFLGTGLVMASFLITNVYFKADVETWTDYGFFLIRKAPLQVLAAAVLMWAPVVVFFLNFFYFWELLMVFTAAYFTLTGFVITLLLKNGLLKILARHKAAHPEQYEQEA